jgi:hypothetical protein
MVDESNQVDIFSLDEIDVGIDTTDEEVIAAAKYLYMKEQRRMTLQQIAEIFKYKHRNSMYKLLAQWEDSGALEKARIYANKPRAEEIQAVYAEVLDQWPNIIRSIVRVAQHSRSDLGKLQAAIFLNHEIVKPLLAKKEDAGTAESDYASRAGTIDPNQITIPPSLASRVRRLEE